jgi:hypothetical protein
VTVTAVNHNPPNVIARLIGVTPSTHATATASLVGPGQEQGNVIPIGVNIDAADNWASGTQQAVSFDPAVSNTDGQLFTLLKNNFCKNGLPGEDSCIQNGGCGTGPQCGPVNSGDQISKDNGNNWDGNGQAGGTCPTNGNDACQAWLNLVHQYQLDPTKDPILVPIYAYTGSPASGTVVGFGVLTPQTCSGANAALATNADYICFTFQKLITAIGSGPPSAFFGTGNAALTS